tara:strand:+ start:348 stop:500 length:153 start_codon:yes stop_codon:yes gene_type:complete
MSSFARLAAEALSEFLDKPNLPVIKQAKKINKVASIPIKEEIVKKGLMAR